MNKRVIATILSASVLLVIAGVIFLVLAIVQGWDIIGALTSQTAVLIYIVLGVIIVFAISGLVTYKFVGKYK